MDKRKRLTAREAASILQAHGFEFISQKGSHQKWRHPISKKQVIVPFHKGKVLPLGTLRSIQKGSEIPDEAWH